MSVEKSPKLLSLHEKLSDLLDEAAQAFNKPVKKTLLIRTSDSVEGDVVIGDDDLDTVIEHLQVFKSKPPTFTKGEPL